MDLGYYYLKSRKVIAFEQKICICHNPNNDYMIIIHDIHELKLRKI